MSDLAAPPVFISYSWSSPDHESWVLKLANDLAELGIKPIIDKWDLRPGEDANLFMERMVNDPQIMKVIMVCDKLYKRKADAREGGAGTEAQILSAELYRGVQNSKFCAVVSELDANGKPYIPTYYASRIYIDLSDDTSRSEKLEELIRWVFDKPQLVRPIIGPRPSYLNENASGLQLGTSTRARRLIDAAKSHKPFWKSALCDYLDFVSSQMEALRLNYSPNYPEEFAKNIEAFLPYRNEVLEIVRVIAQQDFGADASTAIHRFFENLLPYTVAQHTRNSWFEAEFDNYRYLIYELFIMTVAVVVKAEKFVFAETLICQDYFSPALERLVKEPGYSFSCFQIQQIVTLERLSERRKEHKTSYRAYLLSTRLSESGLSLADLIQADLLLALRAKRDSQFWWPDTLIYSDRHNILPIFARSSSRNYYQNIERILGMDVETLREVVEGIEKAGGFIKNSMFPPASSAFLVGLDRLCSKA